MAAHILTGLKQVIQGLEDESMSLSTIKAATDFDCWTADDFKADIPSDYLPYEDMPSCNVWYLLNDFVLEKLDRETLKTRLLDQLPRIEAEWKAMGFPRMREEWYKAMADEYEN